MCHPGLKCSWWLNYLCNSQHYILAFCLILLCARQASKSSLKNCSTCYSPTEIHWCQSLCHQKSMKFDVLVRVKDMLECDAAWQKLEYTILFRIWCLLSPSHQKKKACEDMKAWLYLKKKKKKSRHDKSVQYFSSQLPTQHLWLIEGWMAGLGSNTEQRCWRLQHGWFHICVKTELPTGMQTGVFMWLWE